MTYDETRNLLTATIRQTGDYHRAPLDPGNPDCCARGHYESAPDPACPDCADTIAELADDFRRDDCETCEAKGRDERNAAEVGGIARHRADSLARASTAAHEALGYVLNGTWDDLNAQPYQHAVSCLAAFLSNAQAYSYNGTATAGRILTLRDRLPQAKTMSRTQARRVLTSIRGEAEELMDASCQEAKSVRTCCGCDGHAVSVVETPDGRTWVGDCDNCGGLLGHFSKREELLPFVNLGEFCSQDPGRTRYFDVTVGEARIHGWFDPETKAVTQIG